MRRRSGERDCGRFSGRAYWNWCGLRAYEVLRLVVVGFEVKRKRNTASQGNPHKFKGNQPVNILS